MQRAGRQTVNAPKGAAGHIPRIPGFPTDQVLAQDRHIITYAVGLLRGALARGMLGAPKLGDTTPSLSPQSGAPGRPVCFPESGLVLNPALSCRLSASLLRGPTTISTTVAWLVAAQGTRAGRIWQWALAYEPAPWYINSSHSRLPALPLSWLSRFRIDGTTTHPS